MPKRVRVTIGDVFTIPIAPNELANGQVVDRAGPQLLVVTFRSAEGALTDVTTSGVELAGIVFDAKHRNGDWPTVSHQPPVTFTEPWFVVGNVGLENLRLQKLRGNRCEGDNTGGSRSAWASAYLLPDGVAVGG